MGRWTGSARAPRPPDHWSGPPHPPPVPFVHHWRSARARHLFSADSFMGPASPPLRVLRENVNGTFYFYETFRLKVGRLKRQTLQLFSRAVTRPPPGPGARSDRASVTHRTAARTAHPRPAAHPLGPDPTPRRSSPFRARSGPAAAADEAPTARREPGDRQTTVLRGRVRHEHL